MGENILVYLTKAFSPMSFDMLSKLGGSARHKLTIATFIFTKVKTKRATLI